VAEYENVSSTWHASGSTDRPHENFPFCSVSSHAAMVPLALVTLFEQTSHVTVRPS
jgi:hypothetical protein